MTTEFGGLSDFADELEDFADAVGDAADSAEIDRAVDRGVEQTAEQISDDASRLAPVDTGRLANSLRTERRGSGEWAVIADTDYAKAIEYGRGPVVATEADALRFEIDGQVFFRKSVGPAPAQPFLRPALDMHRSALSRNIAAEIRRVVLAEL